MPPNRSRLSRLITIWSFVVLVAQASCVTDHVTSTEQNLEISPDGAAGASVGFVAFGDMGTGGEDQYEVAKAIERYCLQQVCQFVAGLGDNIYTLGVRSVADSQFESKFERPYASIPLKFYMSLGNHDHYGSVRAQIDYTKKSKKWVMPERYYRFKRLDVELFVLDTTEFDDQQRAWLDERLAASKAKWKIVYGHHPIYSYGRHGDAPWLIEKLLPLLARHKVDFYLSGHEHDQQVLAMEGLIQVVSGGGGVALRRTALGNRSLYAESTHGFAHMLIEGGKARLVMVRENGSIAFQKEFTK